MLLSKTSEYALIATMAFMAFDILTGLIKALLKKDFSSTKLRTGLQNKIGFVLAMVLMVGIQISCNYVDLGIKPPTILAICVYIIFTEIVSITENIFVLSPQLKNSMIGQLLKQVKGDSEKNGF